MASEKKRVMGELAAWAVAAISMAAATGWPAVDPAAMNPYLPPPPPPPPKSEAVREVENKIGWQIIQQALFGKVIEKPKLGG